MKQTAVEWLIEQLESHNGVTKAAFENVIKKAKSMEELQFLECGYFYKYENVNNKGIEEYYNENFKNK